MKDVSIIIPVWNAEDYLPRCLDSIVAQTWDHDRIEVILIDDGSTDGSGPLCDAYAQRHPMFKVIHQANTGSPAAPRNRGIDVASGEFVFFCDNDDFLGPEAVERMVRHASAWGSDVLLVKMGQAGGRDIPRKVFEEQQPKADLYASAVTSTLGPWKLFRRSLIVENGIRFPEDCSFDDSVFTLHAYLRAGTVSVANDYEYYFWVLRPDGGNVSTGDTESVWHRMDRRFRGLERLFALVDTYADPERAEQNLLPKLIREPLAATVRRLPKYSRDEADMWADAFRILLRPHYSPAVADQLRFDVQLMYAILLQTDDSEGLCAMIKGMPKVPDGVRFLEVEGRVVCELVTGAASPARVCVELGLATLRSILTIKDAVTAARWERGSLTIEGELTLRAGRPPALLELEMRLQDQREKDRTHVMPVQVLESSDSETAGGRIFVTTIRWRSIVARDVLETVSLETAESQAAHVRHRWDLDMVVRSDGEVRSTRIGADREPGVFGAFASGAMASATSLFVPDETGEKNLSLWEVTSGSDLSGFRPRRNRPAANTRLFTELSCNDYVSAHATAVEIETGRFDATAGRTRQSGRRLLSGARSLARRVLRGIKRRLRRLT